MNILFIYKVLKYKLSTECNAVWRDHISYPLSSLIHSTYIYSGLTVLCVSMASVYGTNY